MLLSAEIMLQGVSINLATFSRFHNDLGGQTLVIFIIAVAACKAAIALALILTLFQRSGTLDIAAWHELREANQLPFQEDGLPEEPPRRAETRRRPAPDGIKPNVSSEQTDCRPDV
jgi:NADH-quinone oxidoreductase subunit K